MNVKSKSVLSREEGNRVYKSLDNVTSPVLKEMRLNKCIKSYQIAVNEACNDDELSSAYKNIGVVQFEMAK